MCFGFMTTTILLVWYYIFIKITHLFIQILILFWVARFFILFDFYILLYLYTKHYPALVVLHSTVHVHTTYQYDQGVYMYIIGMYIIDINTY